MLLVAYLAAVAAQPAIVDALPHPLRWFGRPGSMATTTIVVGVLVAVIVMAFRSSGSHHLVGVSFSVIAVLIGTSAVLGLAAYWGCHDENHPALFTPLMLTAQLIKGSSGDYSLGGHICPDPTPVGLEIARIAAVSAIFTGLGGVVVGVFRSQVDRFRANVAESVTAIVGVEDDTESIVSGVARTLDHRGTLVVITDAGDSRAQRLRRLGARVVHADFNTPSTLVSLRLWRNLSRLYLMAPDPAINLLWLDLISRRLAQVANKRRLPLIVRIDDPWLAEAWRAQQFGGSDIRWAADVVGKYEVTAGRLLDAIVATGNIRRVFVCGTSQLTLALCANLTQRALERDFYTPPGSVPLPALTLVERDADDYLKDHEFYRQQAGFISEGPMIDAVADAPTVPTMLRLIGDADPATTAVILVGTHTATIGTRLAARFPQMPVYTSDLNTTVADDSVQVVGRLQSYSLVLDTREGQVQDTWERAARLIHERYVATLDPSWPRGPAAVPWSELDEFYRGSNRRQVRNALWMVEQIAGHTWNTWGSPPVQLSGADMADLPPLEQLALMGFDHYSALSMAKAEHEDWCRYYRRNGWKYGTPRDDAHKIHDKLVDWSEVESNPDLLNAAVRSLAATLWSLRQLGYRSRPLWQSFIRVGTVTAEQRSEPWTWQSDSGHTMQADAGDWAVQADGKTWSVRDDIFRETYEPADEPGRWRRKGRVQARPAYPGETVETLEGPTTAADGDWIVRGVDGEQWPVPGAEFTCRYAAFHPPADAVLPESG
ncbi:RyR domain-containing protein [Mycobacterium intermedium]|uniref:RyR domain-containing protein n=1 Tax=Mycobacterium intermedium TaxID=28445 RepID=UPI0021F27275|nr:RyR domain-containing protein [Mycobacterium intermedium]